MYQDLQKEFLFNDFQNLLKNAKDYTETLDTEFMKYKILNVSGNN